MFFLRCEQDQKTLLTKSAVKIHIFFDICKLFEKKMKIKCVFTAHL